MNRRQFLKSTALCSASVTLLPRVSFGANLSGGNPYQRLEQLYLSDFDAEQDEGPILFGNGRQTWLTTLRRKDHPASEEIVSCFSLNGETWKETNPVTGAGQYEAVAATCASGGEPIVVWTAIENHCWLIKAAIARNQKYQPAVTLSDPAQRSINPVVKATGPCSYLVAWEVFAKGQFSIYLSRFDDGHWGKPVRVAGETANCFEPAMEVAPSGEIYLAYEQGSNHDIVMRVDASLCLILHSLPRRSLSAFSIQPFFPTPPPASSPTSPDPASTSSPSSP